MPDWRRTARISTAVLVVLVLVVFAVLNSVVNDIARDNLVNTDDRVHDWTPWSLGFVHENVTIKQADGPTLSAWWIPGFSNETVVIVDGLGSTKGRVLRRWGENLHDAGYHILAVDLRNHGESGDGRHGHVSFGTDESDDVRAAVEYVRGAGGPPEEGIAVYGASMGGAAVMLAATRDPAIDAVIADSAFASFEFQAQRDGAEDGYPGWLVDWVLKRMDALTAATAPRLAAPELVVGSLEMPLLLAHCSNESRVWPESFGRLAAAAPQAATWFEECHEGISDTFHVDGFATPGYNETVRGFLDAALRQ